MNTFNCVAAAIMLLPLTVHQAFHLNWHSVALSGWLGMIYMAVGSSVAAYTIMYWALRYMTASRVGAMSYFQPVVVILLSIAFLGERPSRNLLVGTALVLVGVIFLQNAAKPEPSRAAQAPERTSRTRPFQCCPKVQTKLFRTRRCYTEWSVLSEMAELLHSRGFRRQTARNCNQAHPPRI